MKPSTQMASVIAFYQASVLIYLHDHDANKIAELTFDQFEIVNQNAVDFELKLRRLTDNPSPEIAFATIDVPVGNQGKIVSKRIILTTEEVPGSSSLQISGNTLDDSFKPGKLRVTVENIASQILNRTPAEAGQRRPLGVGVVYRANLPESCEHCGSTVWTPTPIPDAMTPYVKDGTKSFTCGTNTCSHVEYLK